MTRDDYDLEAFRERVLDAVMQMLINRIRHDAYPSATMMDVVERYISEDRVPQYLAVLFAKLTRDEYPSMDLLRRLVLFAAPSR